MALENRAHELFAQEYAKHHSSRKAAMAIGLHPNGGNRLLQRPEIQKRVDQLADMAFSKENITAFRVIRELARIAFADPRGLTDEHGCYLPLHELDDDTAAVIAGVKVAIEGGKRGKLKRGHAEEGNEEETELTVVKDYKMVGKTEALITLAKHFKLIGDEADGANALANALADRLNAAKRREQAAQDAEDAVVRAPTAAKRSGAGLLSYGMPDEPSNPHDVTNPRLRRAQFDPESLHFDLPGAEVATGVTKEAVAATNAPTAASGATQGGIDMLADLDADADFLEDHPVPPTPSSRPGSGFLVTPAGQAQPATPRGDGDEVFW